VSDNFIINKVRSLHWALERLLVH